MGRRRLLLAATLCALVCVPLASAAATSAPKLGFVAASLQQVQGRYYVDQPGDSYVVEIATAPDANADGSFVAAHVVDSLTGLRPQGTSLDWRADRPLPAGRYWVHAGDVGPGGTAWSGATGFSVVRPCVIPNVRGRTLAAAGAALAARNCRVGAVRRIHSARAAGRVVRTDPPIGTPVPPHTNVVVFVSRGPLRRSRA